jgi:Family of unknown function (DUF6519)
MPGDFTRDSFDPLKNFTRVLMQQGRPQLDADWNEQIAIFWRYWRGFVADLIGPFAGPAQNCGFGVIAMGDFPLPDNMSLSAKEQEDLRTKLKNNNADFLVGPGHFYVNGILCQNPRPFPYASQIASSEQSWVPQKNTSYLVYLDVWERAVSALEDDTIREPALNGIDTCIRSKVMWRVRTWPMPKKGSIGDAVLNSSKLTEQWPTIVQAWQPGHRGSLRAKAMATEPADATASPGSGYRGLQNQLYRIEIHDDGSMGPNSRPTFKMSRENGSVEFRILNVSNDRVTLDSMGRDPRFGLKSGDWVEIVAPPGHFDAPGPLRQVQNVDISRRQVTLQETTTGTAPRPGLLLRRWDHAAGDRKGGLELRDGAVVIKEGSSEQSWLALENGLRIQFQPSTPANRYRTGDYWLIPARTATGDILWPQDGANPKAIPPHGIERYFAPLGIIGLNKYDVLETQADCRPKFKLPVEFGF